MNRDLLEQPFDKKYIKKRQGNFGLTLEYLEVPTILQRLNDAFAGDWSFEIIEHIQIEDEVIVLGKLTSEGVIKQQFGSSKITRSKSGNKSISIGDDLKAATSDCIKKCATLFGVGLHLYSDLESAGDGNGKAKKPLKPNLDTLKGQYFDFGNKHNCFSSLDDEDRHKWQEIAIGKVSTTTWTVADYRKAILLLEWRCVIGINSDALLGYLNKAKKMKGMTKTFLAIMDVKKVTELTDINNWQVAMSAAKVGFEQKVNTVDIGKAFMRASEHDGLLDTYLGVVEVDKLSKLDVEDVTDWKNMLATAVRSWNEEKDQDISPKLIVEGISGDEA